MGCGCKATIGEKDSRAELWMYIFGSRIFPILGPFCYNMGDVVGIGYKGDAKSLTTEQRERLVEKMTEKFSITRAMVEESLKDGVVPIKAEGVIVEICRMHVMDAVVGDPWTVDDDEAEAQWEPDDINHEYDDGEVF
jgi:hypothetical protein